MVIYKTTNLINGKIYIGKDANNNEKYLGGGKLLKLAIKKYGRKNFKKEILEVCVDKNSLNKQEQHWIEKLKSRVKDVGYNILVGGEISPMEGNKHTDETKLKMVLNHVDVSGKNNPMFGKTIEDIWRENGFNENEIKIKKQKWTSNHNTFFKKHNPFKNKHRYGVLNPFYGKKHSKKTKKTLSKKAKKKRVVQYDLSGVLIKEWPSTMEIYRLLGINCRNNCRGLTKTACGFIWKYKDGKNENRI